MAINVCKYDKSHLLKIVSMIARDFIHDNVTNVAAMRSYLPHIAGFRCVNRKSLLDCVFDIPSRTAAFVAFRHNFIENVLLRVSNVYFCCSDTCIHGLVIDFIFLNSK